ncbi:MAG: helix-turn-helix domain-containing protein [Alphaproteobacteria bacterium]
MEEKVSLSALEELAETDVGEALRRVREFYGKSILDVERTLRIRGSQIDAIERGDFSVLPGRVYAIGFVRSYAEYLGLDGDRIVYLFKAQYMDGQGQDALSFPVPASETKTPAVWLVSLTLIASSVFMFAWHYFNRPDRSVVQSIVSLPEHIETYVNEEILTNSVDMPFQDAAGRLSVGADDLDNGVVAEPAVEDMAGEVQKEGVILRIIGESWVEIKNDEGGIFVSRILEAGDEYFVPDSPGLSMSLGNAANVEIVVEGRVLKPLGKDGDVRRGIPLNTTYLKTLDFVEDSDASVEAAEEDFSVQDD